jgi:hypothetical protein
VVRDCAAVVEPRLVVVAGQGKRRDVAVLVGDLAVRHPVVAAAEVVVVAPRARSAGPGVRLAAAASPRSSGVKSSIRWKRRRLAAYGSSKVTGKPFGSPAAPHLPT